MTAKSICTATSDYPNSKEAYTPALSTYQEYVQGLCFRYPSLSTLSSFLTNPKARTSACRATAVEFRAGVTSPDIRLIPDIGCLRSEFKIVAKKDVDTPTNDSTLDILGRILIIEDLTVETITLLGTELDIDPLFLATHLHTVHRTGMHHQTPDDANLPSRLHRNDYVNVSYHQPVTCNDIFPSGARFMTDTAINRKLVFLRGTSIGLAQHRVSVIKLKQEAGFWLGMFLVSQYRKR